MKKEVKKGERFVFLTAFLFFFLSFINSVSVQRRVLLMKALERSNLKQHS